MLPVDLSRGSSLALAAGYMEGSTPMRILLAVDY